MRIQRTINYSISLLLLLVSVSRSHSQPQIKSDELNEYMNTLVQEEHFNGAVSVTMAGKTFLAEGYGWANVELKVPNTTKTKFRIGSITKQFTAMAIMILQERGKLHIDDFITTYIQDAPAAWSEIKINHLLTHTSGLMHSWPLKGFRETMMVPATLHETVARFTDEPLLFAPGNGFKYSGLGYFILAQIIEDVSSQSYEEFLHKNIFESLDMKDTGADVYTAVLPNRASGYVGKEDSLQHAGRIYMPILTGGGNLYSTAEDLARWDKALNSGELISEASYQNMYAPTSAREDYASGWVVRRKGNRTQIRHGGGVPGFRAEILRYPHEQVCVVVLSNVTPIRRGIRKIADDLADIVLAKVVRK